MSGRTRLTVTATAATLLAGSALLPLVETSGWYPQAAFLLVVQALAGALTRRLSPVRTLTVAVQALCLLLMLTMLFSSAHAFGGVVPGPDTFRHFAELLEAGGEDIGRYSIPAPLSDGIRLMLVGGVLVIGLAVDVLAVTLRSAAPAGLPLLALYSVAAGLSDGGPGWLWFVLAAGGYLTLLLAEGRERLSRWGRVFGGATTPGRPKTSGLGPTGVSAPVRTGRRIGAVALGVALVVPLALPALDSGLLDGTGGGSGNGSGGGGTISAVNPLVSLQNSLNQPEDREVMSYTTDSEDTSGLYLRIVALDQFDGTAWRPAERRIVDVPSRLPAPRGLAPDVRTREISTRVTAAQWYAQDWLPMPYPASDVRIGGQWRYEPVGRTLVGDRGQTTRGVTYTVNSLEVQPTARQLADAPAPPGDVVKEFTRVPRSLPAEVARTARKVTAGAKNDYERAVDLQTWFASEGGFTYNTQVQAGSGPLAIARFLKQKEGFCVHFSFAMAAMARTLGIPARVAVGFTPGTADSESRMSVGLRDAHAWPELYFEGIGWTRFEPTPNRGSTPSYTQPEAPTDTPSDTSSAQPSVSDEPGASASPSESCPQDQRRIGECGSTAPQVVAGGGGQGPPSGTIVGIALAALVVVGAPFLPLLWRTRTRARRLATSGGRGPAELAARTLAAWAEVMDTAWDHGIAPDDSLTPRGAADRLVRLGHLDPEAADALHRLAASVEQVLYAPRPQPPNGLNEDVRRVGEALRTSSGRATRLRARFAPRSAIRVVWRLSERRSAWTARWTASGWNPSRWSRPATALWQRLGRQRG
ncbi:transglutaminase TgpA family protein [Streptomyces tsukubensis]|uniref:Transglutaminase n=1 Tax=Streptomyces tsukubensis TaxID=83656 RepID=A0A1V4A6S0_9ACTN|nr:DUF3488 and transglutaminase-like domain-containing protein [Streptomyces tsukubensis]OON77639.1 transglutaminase [Streptomyces tsukubensis]QFR93146.1 DUF4129 domain-containing protein [Streptomyces tsukubensis]